jgi:hypothetical protein
MSLGQTNRPTYPFVSIGTIIDTEKARVAPCRGHAAFSDGIEERKFDGSAGFRMSTPVNLGELARQAAERRKAPRTPDPEGFQTLGDYIKSKMAASAVNSPQHYTQGKVECIEAIAAATVNKSGIEAACVANAIKYLWRYEAKGKPVQDVEKAQWYINKLLEVLNGKQA